MNSNDEEYGVVYVEPDDKALVGTPRRKSELGQPVKHEFEEAPAKKGRPKKKAEPEEAAEAAAAEGPMQRTKARELVMQLFFQMEAQQDFSQDQIDSYRDWQFSEVTGQLDYYDELTAAFIENREAIDAMIEKASNGWHVSRLARVDLAVLRLCVAEIAFLKKDDVPVNVSVNEAVKLAKKFGGDDSGKFVNGVLGTVARSL
ncbi:MAG: transcription antitermination factor NusB [Firmicutes bacterium]|nr:transcription antitermination factor NusB [Bacillota bacterium]